MGDRARTDAATVALDGSGSRGSSLEGLLLVCDWNGTLVSDRGRAWRATNAVLRQWRRPVISEAEFTNCFRLPLDSFFAHLGLNDAHEARLAWNAQMRGVVPALAPGARRLLEDSASDGMVVGVLSAADTKLVQEDITALCLTELVAFVVGNADSKADVLKALAVASGRVPTYIGDTEHDMQEARAAGARALGYAGGYRPSEALREAGAEAVFSHLAQVRPALLAKNPLRDSV